LFSIKISATIKAEKQRCSSLSDYLISSYLFLLAGSFLATSSYPKHFISIAEILKSTKGSVSKSIYKRRGESYVFF